MNKKIWKDQALIDANAVMRLTHLNRNTVSSAVYFGQSRRLFKLQPGMVWPDGSWFFSKLLGNERTRLLASTSSVLSAIGFVTGGVRLLMGRAWGSPVVMDSAVFSTVIFILFWDGELQKLADKGGVGILINIAILVVLLIL